MTRGQLRVMTWLSCWLGAVIALSFVPAVPDPDEAAFAARWWWLPLLSLIPLAALYRSEVRKLRRSALRTDDIRRGILALRGASGFLMAGVLAGVVVPGTHITEYAVYAFWFCLFVFAYFSNGQLAADSSP